MKRILSILSVIPLLCLFVSCGTIADPEMAEKINVPKFVKESKGDVLVSIYRSNSFAGAAYSDWVSVNGNIIGGIKPNEKMEFYIPAKRIELGVISLGGWTDGWKTQKMVLNPRAKDQLHFITSPLFTDINNCVKITPVSKEKYQSKTQSATQVKVGTY